MRRLLLTTAAALAVLVCAPAAGAWTWPTGGALLQPFVFDRNHPYAAGQHRGIDVAGAAGSDVSAPASGAVSFAGSEPSSGKSVTIQTIDGYSVTLTHLGSIRVARGASVAEGVAVGSVGSSGDAEWPQLYVHLGIRITADAQGYVDPLAFLPPRALPVATPAPEPETAPEPVPAVPALPPVAPEVSPPAPIVAEPPAGTDPTTADPGAPETVAPTEPAAAPGVVTEPQLSGTEPAPVPADPATGDLPAAAPAPAEATTPTPESQVPSPAADPAPVTESVPTPAAESPTDPAAVEPSQPVGGDMTVPGEAPVTETVPTDTIATSSAPAVTTPPISPSVAPSPTSSGAGVIGPSSDSGAEPGPPVVEEQPVPISSGQPTSPPSPEAAAPETAPTASDPPAPVTQAVDDPPAPSNPVAPSHDVIGRAGSGLPVLPPAVAAKAHLTKRSNRHRGAERAARPHRQTVSMGADSRVRSHGKTRAQRARSDARSRPTSAAPARPDGRQHTDSWLFAIALGVAVALLLLLGRGFVYARRSPDPRGPLTPVQAEAQADPGRPSADQEPLPAEDLRWQGGCLARTTPRANPGRSCLALRGWAPPHRACGGLWRSVGRFRPLPPTARERRSDGLGDRRTRDTRDGGRRSGRCVAA